MIQKHPTQDAHFELYEFASIRTRPRRKYFKLFYEGSLLAFWNTYLVWWKGNKRGVPGGGDTGCHGRARAADIPPRGNVPNRSPGRRAPSGYLKTSSEAAPHPPEEVSSAPATSHKTNH